MSVLARISQGDNTAFAECVDRYGDLVWSLARRMTRNPADAEDATQEIFLSLWRHAARFDAQKGSEATFIATLARRALIDRLRQVQRRPVEVPMDEIEPVTWSEAAQGESGVEAARAAAAMATLRPEQQQIISLSVIEGLSQSEIAARTGMPLGTVKTLMRRGMLAVRELLGELRI